MKTEKLRWYQDAVFMELNVRAFKDSNGDGWGDLEGVRSKVGYIKSLGVDAVWLQPIMPSPLNDDGYDVSDFRNIFPAYGTIDDFKRLVEAFHEHNIKVIVEIIPNHTSEEHPWFQASRDPNHPDHEKYKDYYVWADDDKGYPEARIIFLDTEPSNWSYDEKRGQFFWHRFFSSQPDLNYDNPAVQQEMLDTVRFWIDQGADGLRVDAPPYLFEREGTSCENLPETHAFLKRMRAFVDSYSPDVLLLSEANQWPEDVVEYFGDGDEMMMNFHFPLMPRLFMALAVQDAEPIKKILERTPELPEGCTWGTFLRCHDELTLEMVTPEEREWMWRVYAPDPDQRRNLGIRRRLAPLMDGDVRKNLLMHSMLLTMGGAPFLYYGDEIGMGDDVRLFDRNGLRTPMQWDGSKNGGFSNAPREKLYAPVIDFGEYGYTKVNVAIQEADSDSLLNRLRRLIAVRKAHPTFARGSFSWREFVSGKQTVAAYDRLLGSERILVLNNLTDEQVTGIVPGNSEKYEDLVSGRQIPSGELTLQPCEFLWLKTIG